MGCTCRLNLLQASDCAMSPPCQQLLLLLAAAAYNCSLQLLLAIAACNCCLRLRALALYCPYFVFDHLVCRCASLQAHLQWMILHGKLHGCCQLNRGSCCLMNDPSVCTPNALQLLCHTAATYNNLTAGYRDLDVQAFWQEALDDERRASDS